MRTRLSPRDRVRTMTKKTAEKSSIKRALGKFVWFGDKDMVQGKLVCDGQPWNLAGRQQELSATLALLAEGRERSREIYRKESVEHHNFAIHPMPLSMLSTWKSFYYSWCVSSQDCLAWGSLNVPQIPSGPQSEFVVLLTPG